MDSNRVTHLSQSVDYLGFLEAKLRDLQGIPSMTYELIQNADDVKDQQGQPAATRITFDIRDDALYIYNDGLFREEDFERLRHIASGGKREEANTTGAFGIGFISVYQVTDYPELFSSGRHWTLRPDARESKRIEERRCETQETKFRLPWATDPDSDVRRQLRLEAINPLRLHTVKSEIVAAAELAVFFLKQLKTLTVKRNGVAVLDLERIDEGEQLLVEAQTGDIVIWKRIIGNFDADAEQLRHRFPIQVEPERRSFVQIILPEETVLSDGRLFATLPTETTTPLPFHIDADFYPSTDRKQILFSGGYQTEWNRKAVQAAAEALKQTVPSLPNLLSGTDTIRFLAQLKQTQTQAASGMLDTAFSAFWDKSAPLLSSIPIVYTATGTWKHVRDARLFDDVGPDTADLLSRLGIFLVHPDLHPHMDFLQDHLGVRRLSLDDIVKAIQQTGVAAGPVGAAPDPLNTFENWERLWYVLDNIVQTQDDQEYVRTRLAQLPLVRTCHNHIVPPGNVWRHDADAQGFFPELNWLHPDLKITEIPGRLAGRFGMRQFIERLEALDAEKKWQAGRLDIPALFAYLAAKRGQIEANHELRSRLCQVPLYPVGDRLYALTDLFLPGGFRDPLGLARLINPDKIGGHAGFLRALGVAELDFRTYAGEQIPKTLNGEEPVSTETLRDLIQLLAVNLSSFQEDSDLRTKLQKLPLIRCTDGQLRPATETYANQTITAVLDNRAPVAEPPKTPTIQSLYQWLGVQESLRAVDIVDYVAELIDKLPTQEAVARVEGVFDFLANSWENVEENSKKRYQRLTTMAWLPGTADETRWYRPDELYAEFQKYLFQSQANFLRLSRKTQDAGGGRAGFLTYLGVKSVPAPRQVVDHLLQCCRTHTKVNANVYSYLNDNLDKLDSHQLEKLSHYSSLLLDNHGYVKPKHAYWNNHPFGAYRFRLDPDLRKHDRFLEAVGVRETPQVQDYIDVLLEISAAFAPEHKPLDADTHTIVMNCFEELSTSLADKHAETYALLQKLAGKPVIPEDRPKPLLYPPDRIFFEDKAGLVPKFDGCLDANVLPRPQHAWRAMQAIGVRNLSDMVQVEFIDKKNPIEDTYLHERLVSRRHLLQRVIAAEQPPTTRGPVALLPEFTCMRVERLVIRFQFTGFQRPIDSHAEEVSAFWDKKSGVLYTSGRSDSYDWITIGHEMAFSMHQTHELPSRAMGFKEVLAGSSISDVSRTLDKLGYPPSDNDEDYTPATADPVALGGTTRPDEAIRPSQGTSAPDAVNQNRELVPTSQPKTLPREALNGKGIQPDSGPAGPDDQKAPASSTSASGHSGTTQSVPPKIQATRRPPTFYRGGSMRISYALPDANDNGDTGDGDDPRKQKKQATRTKTDKSGVARVLAYERRNGREPTEQPHHNRGFDVRSEAPDGSVRYIEVKSLSQAWSRDNPAMITAPQHKFAQEKGNQFWLYVVEYAQDDEAFQIYPIQDPASKINRYAFDYGWQQFIKKEEPLV